MVTIERDGWRVSRRIGVGDREHVRAGLLQVCCVNEHRIEDQVRGALDGAIRSGKTLRIYINASRLALQNPQALRDVAHGVFSRARDHDLMEETDISRERFDWVIGRCDIWIEPLLVEEGSKENLSKLIQEVWKSTNGRDLMNGNDRRLHEAELKKKFPQYYGREDELWKLWSKIV